MKKEELVYEIEKILIEAGQKVNKKVARAIERALKKANTGADIYEILEISKLNKETLRILENAKERAGVIVDQEWESTVIEENDHKALIAAGAVALALKLKHGSGHYSFEMADKVETAKRAVQGTITQALKSPGYMSVGPAFRRFEAPVVFYNRVVTDGINDLRNGRRSYDAIVKSAVRELTRSGLRYIDYKSGHTNRVDVAVSRAILTEMSHIQGDIAMENAQEIGTEYFEVDAHAGARPEHAEWQGGVYTMKELEDICGLGDVTGLKGANCYHQFFPFIPGVSKRQYSDKWLKEQIIKENTPVSFGGREYTTYEARQKQREMEAAMRAQREKITLLKGLNVESKTDYAKYTAQRHNYESFSAAMGEKTHFDRVYRDGLGRV